MDKTGVVAWRSFLLLIGVVDVATVVPFFILHQFLLAWTWAPLAALLLGLIPAALVVASFRAWRITGLVQGVRFGAILAACGAIPWAIALTIFFGRPVGNWSFLVDAVAALLGAAAAYASTRTVGATIWTAVAVFFVYGAASPFLGAGPVRWAEVRALFAFSVACVTGGLGLGWATTRRGLTKGTEAVQA